MSYEDDDHLKATELRLGLPGSDEEEDEEDRVVIRNNKRASSDISHESRTNSSASDIGNVDAPPAKLAPYISNHFFFLNLIIFN